MKKPEKKRVGKGIVRIAAAVFLCLMMSAFLPGCASHTQGPLLYSNHPNLRPTVNGIQNHQADQTGKRIATVDVGKAESRAQEYSEDALQESTTSDTERPSLLSVTGESLSVRAGVIVNVLAQIFVTHPWVRVGLAILSEMLDPELSEFVNWILGRQDQDTPIEENGQDEQEPEYPGANQAEGPQSSPTVIQERFVVAAAPRPIATRPCVY